MTESPRCKCQHRQYDHIGSGRCDEGTKRCRCMSFKPEPNGSVGDEEAGAIS